MQTEFRGIMGCIPSPAQPGYRPLRAARNGCIAALLVLVILIAGTGGVSGAIPVDAASAGTTVPAPLTRITDLPPPPPPPAGPPVITLDPPQVSDTTVTIDGLVQPSGRGVTVDQVTWDWGDGTPRETQNTLPATHTYRVGGPYVVQVEARQSDAQLASTSLAVSIPTQTPTTHAPTRLGAVVAYSADAYDGKAVVTFDGASDEYGYYTVYRYPDGRGWYRHQSDSERHQESRTQIEDSSMVIVGTVAVSASPPIEAGYVYPPSRYGIGDIVGETATGSFQVVTQVEKGNPSYYSPGSYVHKLVWKDDQGRWRTYDEGSSETYDAQADFEARYPVKLAHVEPRDSDRRRPDYHADFDHDDNNHNDDNHDDDHDHGAHPASRVVARGRAADPDRDRRQGDRRHRPGHDPVPGPDGAADDPGAPAGGIGAACLGLHARRGNCHCRRDDDCRGSAHDVSGRGRDAGRAGDERLHDPARARSAAGHVRAGRRRHRVPLPRLRAG